MSFLAVIGLFAGVAYLGRDVMAAAVARVLDEIQHSEWSAQGAQATSSAPDRGPQLAIDPYSNTSWAAGEPGNAPVDLTAVFAPPFRLTYVVVSPGAANNDAFHQERRPSKVEIIVISADGKEKSRTVELATIRPNTQSFYVGADQVSEVTLRILESAGPDGAPVSVAGVQFAGRP